MPINFTLPLQIPEIRFRQNKGKKHLPGDIAGCEEKLNRKIFFNAETIKFCYNYNKNFCN